MTTLVTNGSYSYGKTERQGDGATGRRGDGAILRTAYHHSAFLYIPPSPRRPVALSLRLSLPLPRGPVERRLWKRPFIAIVGFIANNRPRRRSGSGQCG